MPNSAWKMGCRSCVARLSLVSLVRGFVQAPILAQGLVFCFHVDMDWPDGVEPSDADEVGSDSSSRSGESYEYRGRYRSIPGLQIVSDRAVEAEARAAALLDDAADLSGDEPRAKRPRGILATFGLPRGGIVVVLWICGGCVIFRRSAFSGIRADFASLFGGFARRFGTWQKNKAQSLNRNVHLTDDSMSFVFYGGTIFMRLRTWNIVKQFTLPPHRPAPPISMLAPAGG